MSEFVEVANENTDADVATFDGITFFKLGTDTPSGLPVVANDFEALRFEANRNLSTDEIQHLMQILGFVWKVTVRGDKLNTFEPDGPNAVVVYVELASSQSRSRFDRFDEFVAGVNDYIADGSTVKKDGSQLVGGMEDVTVTVWADKVTQEVTQETIERQAKLKKLASRPSPFAPEPLSGKTQEEIAKKLTALISIRESLTAGEQDILTMAYDLLNFKSDETKQAIAAKEAAEAKLDAVRTALSA